MGEGVWHSGRPNCTALNTRAPVVRIRQRIFCFVTASHPTGQRLLWFGMRQILSLGYVRRFLHGRACIASCASALCGAFQTAVCHGDGVFARQTLQLRTAYTYRQTPHPLWGGSLASFGRWAITTLKYILPEIESMPTQ